MPFLMLVLLATACNDDTTQKQDATGKDLLSTELVNNPHSADGLDTAAQNALPTMDFTDTLHDFGTLNEGEKAVYDFAFTNNGKTPLIISDAKGSCGCTVAEFPRDPIAPGASGKIQVVFNSIDKSGHQEKSVSVTTNTARSVHMLYFKGDVKADPNKTY